MKLAGIILSIVLLSSCYKREPEKTGLEGNLMPEFSLLLTDSVTYFNTRDIPAGKPVVLFYYSPVCPYCRAQLGEIIEDMDKLKEIQFYFITTVPISEIRHYGKEYHLEKYPNIILGRDITNFFADYFEVPGVPFTAVYGKDRKLRKAFLGKVYGRQIQNTAMN